MGWCGRTWEGTQMQTYQEQVAIVYIYTPTLAYGLFWIVSNIITKLDFYLYSFLN